MEKFTCICQEIGSNETFIDVVEADSWDDASGLAVLACAEAWGQDVDDICCVGVIAGEVEVF